MTQSFTSGNVLAIGGDSLVLFFGDRSLFLTRSLFKLQLADVSGSITQCGQTYKFPQQRKKQYFVWKDSGWTLAFPGSSFPSVFYVSLYVYSYFPAQGRHLTKFLCWLFPGLCPLFPFVFKTNSLVEWNSQLVLGRVQVCLRHNVKRLVCRQVTCDNSQREPVQRKATQILVPFENLLVFSKCPKLQHARVQHVAVRGVWQWLRIQELLVKADR